MSFFGPIQLTELGYTKKSVFVILYKKLLR